MNRTEAVGVVAYLVKAGVLPAADGQAVAWHDVLHPYRVEDVREAVRAVVARGPRWVNAGDVAAEVRAIRGRRIAAHGTPPPPPPGLDVAGELAFTRAYIAALGDGGDPDQADTAACAQIGAQRPALGNRSMAELTTGKGVPGE